MTAGDAVPDTASLLLGDHVGWQLRRLCTALGLDSVHALYAALMRDLLGAAAAWPVGVAPAWRSQVSDDHTPVEYSITFGMDTTPRLRFVVEPCARWPDLRANMQAGLRVLELLVDRYGLSLERFALLRGLFTPRRPQGSSGLCVAAEDCSILVLFACSRTPVDREVEGASCELTPSFANSDAGGGEPPVPDVVSRSSGGSGSFLNGSFEFGNAGGGSIAWEVSAGSRFGVVIGFAGSF